MGAAVPMAVKLCTAAVVPEGTNETDLLVTYFNTGYLVDTIVTGQSTGNDINFKSKNVGGTFRIKLSTHNHTWTPAFTVSGKQVVDLPFEVGTLAISVKKAKGYAKGHATLYQWYEWDEAGEHKSEWRHVNYWSLEKGAVTLYVTPGKFRVKIKTSDERVQTRNVEVQGVGITPMVFE